MRSDAQLHVLATETIPEIDKILLKVENLPLPDPVSIPFEVTRSNGRWVIEVRIHTNGTNGRHDLGGAEPPAEAPPRVENGNGHGVVNVRLSRVHKKLLQKASLTDPVPAKQLIRLTGYSDNSYVRAALTYLARARLLLRTPDGYLLAPGYQVS